MTGCIGNPDHQTPILFVQTGDDRIIACSRFLKEEHGIVGTTVVFPAVPKGKGGMRFVISNLHTKDEIQRLVDGLAAFATRHPRMEPAPTPVAAVPGSIT